MPDHISRPNIVLHVGLAKAGTTAIQMAAYARRNDLFEQGVLYPGTEYNHRAASKAVGGHRSGWREDRDRPEAPDIRHWQELVDEVRSHPEHTAFISHELFADYSLDVCRRIVSDLGAVPTVIFTLRNQVSAAGSIWQQFVKYGRTENLDEWIQERLDALENHGARDGRFLSRLFLSDLVSKWASVVGPQNVILIALDKAQPNLLFDGFESSLGVPEGFFANVELDRRAENRSFSLDEAETIRAINAQLRDDPNVTWHNYQRLVRYGAVDPLLAEPSTNIDPHPIRVPQWAAQKISELTATEIAKLRQLGVKVVGDLQTIAEVPRNVGENPAVVDIDIETASRLASRVLRKSTNMIHRRRRKLGRIHNQTKRRPMKGSDIQLSAFARALARRVRRKFQSTTKTK